ncbi:contactin-like, partial [Diaphorina citri]|uniref:Contactin-like n=2 Tax=Diaphorina citri TaxID=121845 RepID=A0A3Q0JHC2_DIACI
AGEGGNVTIFCNPEAAPKPKFVWKKDGNIIGSGGRRKIFENGNLLISPVSRDDSGIYSCTATNVHGMDESKGRLIVLHGPSYYEQLPPKITIAAHRNLQLRCSAHTEELLDVAYIWTHNGVRIGNMDLNELETPNINIDGGLLEITNASFADAGEYECVVKSTVGKISTKTTVIVEGPPGLPGGVQVVEVHKTSATIQWTDGATNGRPITHYKIIARTNWNSTWFNVSEHVIGKEVDRYTGRKEASIENVLVPWSTYEFKVIAGNELGYGEPSSPSPQYNTPADKPYQAPSRIGGGGGKIGDLSISWEPLPREKQNAPNIYYKIFWRKKNDTEFQSETLKEYGNVGIAVVRIPSEFYYTEYEVKVQAINDVGPGPESEVVTIFSAEDMPQVAPQGVFSRGFNSTAINVTWNPIELIRENIRGRLIGHRIKYWKEDNPEETAVYYLSRTTRNWALIVGLQPDTKYYVKVMAYNNAGEGPESERYLERTYRKAPQKPPSAVHIKGINPTTVHVTWRYVSPSFEEEPIIGYKVRVWEVDQDMSRANDTIIPVGNTLDADIVDLSPGKRYHMRVLAFSNGGDGRMSSPAITFQMGEEKEFKSGSPALYSASTTLLLVMSSTLYIFVAFPTMSLISSCLFIFVSFHSVFSQTIDELELRCPQHWVQYRDSCYRFVKSPLKTRNDAKLNCKSLDSDLANVNDADEHGFIMYQLFWQDPQRRKWYFGGTQQSPNLWVNEDGTNLNELDAAFLPEPADNVQRDYLAYSFSQSLKRWGFERVTGMEPLLFICEASIQKLHYLLNDDRTYQYGMDIENPDKIPRGPYFIKQPTDVVFDLSKRSILNDITLSCYAGGYPNPSYEWFKEDYVQDRLVANLIDPLSDKRFTLSGGNLIINDPRQVEDRGSYHCKASNKFGSIISESVQLAFGFIGEFNLKRAPEIGNQNWGKAMFCDPPTNYPGVNYYWARDYFPNFVEEDKRVFVSYDGALYFSALEQIDAGNYSCNVQSKVSDTGRNGPFFPLKVFPHSNFQQLKFPNNFPKTFPEAPKAGDKVRLECVAFGYPVPSYNWTRRGSPLPRNAYFENFNRILTIPNVKVEDQGEYICRASNDRSALESSVTISIQAEPNFTIPLTDKHMDNQADLTWTCEAFGVPDVTYSWFRNGELLNSETLPLEDQDRYFIQDNVLTIRYLNPERDPAMYQCRAKNQLKTRYSSAQLRVLTLKPSFKKRPLESETYAGEGGNVTIFCNPEAAPKPKFVWKKDGNIIGSGGRRKIFENGNLLISPVSRDDSGIYSCTATNVHGMDESKGRLIVLHGPSYYEQLPPKITIAAHRNLQLRCSAHTEELLDVAYIWTHNGVRIGNMDLNELETPNINIDGGLLEITNASFADAGEYECVVKSTVGKISTKTTVIVEGPPGLPGGVQVVEVHKTSATIQWTDGATNGRPITHYKIIARTNWNSTWFNVSEHVIGKEVDRYTGRKEASIENVLVPWSTYEFKVIAGNELGYGEPSSPSPQYNTPADKPYQAPSRIGGGGGKIGDLSISWEPLPREKQNAPNIYYKIFWRKKNDTEFQSETLKEYGNVGIAVVRIPSEFYYTEYEVKVQAINDVGPGPESE